MKPSTFSLSTQELLDLYPQKYVLEENVYFKNHIEQKSEDKAEKENELLNVGISGASGFLALHILNYLTQDPRVGKIHALLRSKEKYEEQKKKFKLDFVEDKIEFFIEKDINANSLAFQDLSHFIHTAAELHNLKTVSQLYDSNVALTQKLLNQLSEKTKLHYISTLSVFASSSLQGQHGAYFIKPTLRHKLYGGYAQTKFLSEKLVETRPNSRIVRLGLLTPSSFAPYFQPHEFFTLLFSRLSRLGVYPENFEEAYVDITPVEWAAYNIVSELSDWSYVSHIASKIPASLSSIVKTMSLQSVPEKIWREKLSNDKSIKNMERVFLEYTFYKSRALNENPHYFNLDLFQSTHHDWQGKIENAGYIETYINAYQKRLLT